jgi:hypothetical protein
MMFKHITPHPWTASNNTVWGYEGEYGKSNVARCHHADAPTATQRANARLIAIAPQMYEIIERLGTDEAKALVRYMERDDHEGN